MSLVAELSFPNEALLSVSVAGRYAYAGGTRHFYVIDVTTPATPTVVGTYSPPYPVCGLAVRDGYAFITTCRDETNDGGLSALDVSVPQNPRPVGHYETPGFATAVALCGDYAYVADGGTAQIINISPPTNLRYTGAFSLSGFTKGVAVAGGLVYVSDESYGLHVVDVTTPAAPREVGHAQLTGINPYRVAYTNTHAFVVGSYFPAGGLQVVNVSDPASPRLEGQVAIPGDMRGVSLQGDFVYVTYGPTYQDSTSGVRVFNVQDPAHPTEAGFYSTAMFTWDAAAAGPYVFAATGDFYFGGGTFTILKFTGRFVKYLPLIRR
jgi:hypothetical protein